LRDLDPGGTPAEVVLADERSQPISPSNSDDPSTPTFPSTPSSTIILAPIPTSHQNPDAAQESDTASIASTSTGTADNRNLVPSSNQVLGRRRRERSTEPAEHEHIHGGIPESLGAHTPENESRRKRRRQGSRMRREGETSNLNGTSRPFANGSGASSLHKAAISNATNGRSAVAMNGHTSGKQRTSYFGHDREETTRILIQALTDLGYGTAASSLSQESGFELESAPVASFRNAVLQGEWSQAEDLLFGASTDEGGVRINGNGLVLQDGVDKNVMRFWLRQQKFLELLEKRDTGGALMVLRRELTPLYQDTGKLHFLSRYGNGSLSEIQVLTSLLVCSCANQLKT
jgi:hypothetical protein